MIYRVLRITTPEPVEPHLRWEITFDRALDREEVELIVRAAIGAAQHQAHYLGVPLVCPEGGAQ